MFFHAQLAMKHKAIFLISTLLLAGSVMAQNSPVLWNTPAAGNPIVPGYFADPTIRKFGDTYYIYATTDGTGNGYGPAQVWVSKDFVNWKNVLMNWPTTEVVWAPDVVQQPDGSYRYYYCTPCEVRVGESLSPIGPWENRLGKTDAVLVPDRFVHNAITLDPQLFRDDDGSEYLYFGTWGIYKGFGCGVAKLAPDGKSFTDKKLIENTEITDFFEAPFVFKKDGLYYFTYSSGSCHDDTYRVQYAVSKAGPMGPFEYKGCILQTNADGTIHGPGHHSILIDGDNYYMVYHRHNNPHSIHGFHRQLCIDQMQFDNNGDIKPIEPTHSGVLPASLSKGKSHLKNLAFGATATASSTYSDWFKPEYATDDNNGTLWRAADVAALSDAWLQIDLGKPQRFNTVFTQFEYATFFYQYKIETSMDGSTWQLFADRTHNTVQGSPVIDTTLNDRYRCVRARYIRLTINGTQKNGHFPAVWNMKIYRATPKNDPVKLFPEVSPDEVAILNGYPWIHQKDVADDVKATGRRCLLDVNADQIEMGATVQNVPVLPHQGIAAMRFTGENTIKIDTADLHSLRYNAPYTLTAWINNPSVASMETVANLMPVGNDLATVSLRNGNSKSDGLVAHNASFENVGATGCVRAGEWQHWVVTFDGFNERVYCDGQQISQKNIFLMLRPDGPITIGAEADGGNPFTGWLHSLRLYNYPFSAADVERDRAALSHVSVADLQQLRSRNASTGYMLQLKRLTSSDVEASVVQTDGSQIASGFADYAFAIGKDSTCLAHAVASPQSSTVIRMAGAAEKVFARVTNLFGEPQPVLTVPITTAKNAASLLANATDPIVLESANSYFDSDSTHNGALKVFTVEGDFVMECKVDDMTGLAAKNVPAYNEAGLIMVGTTDDGRQQLVQLGVFPHYNCGNMLTIVSEQGRRQYHNSTGFQFNRTLQIERRGNKIYARTLGLDGVWQSMPGSSLECPSALQGTIKVGLYQTTYSENKASATLSAFKLWGVK